MGIKDMTIKIIMAVVEEAEDMGVIIEIMVIIIEDMVVMMIRKIMITTMGNPVVGINQENLLPLHLKVKTKITKKMTKKMNQNLDHGQNKMVAKVEMKSIFFFDKSLMTD